MTKPHRRRRHGGEIPAGTVTRWLRFVGQNIKGNPAMSFWHVVHDLHVVRHHSDVAVVQEFEWRWYWRALGKTLAIGTRWGAYPGRFVGATHPVRSGQAVFWRRGPKWMRRGRTFHRLLHKGARKISDTRWLRAAELIDRVSGLAFIAGTTHNVVGGDAEHDGPKRKAILHGDLEHLDTFLHTLTATGLCVLFELDGNIHQGTDAYDRLRAIVHDHGGRFYGQLGVEYLFVIDGSNGTVVDVKDTFTIPTKSLWTDHEGRGITFRIRAKS